VPYTETTGNPGLVTVAGRQYFSTDPNSAYSTCVECHHAKATCSAYTRFVTDYDAGACEATFTMNVAGVCYCVAGAAPVKVEGFTGCAITKCDYGYTGVNANQQCLVHCPTNQYPGLSEAYFDPTNLAERETSALYAGTAETSCIASAFAP
jgi:hypothetical protein